MTWVDFAILAIILLSAFVSLIRGFTKEALSLVGWVIAFWVALSFSGQLALLMEGHVESPSLRLVIAFAVLFITTLVLAGLINHLAGQLVKRTGLSGTDRMVGMVFGIVRGALIVAVLVLLAGLTTLPEDSWWRESILVHHFQNIAMWLRDDVLPSELAQSFRY